MTCCSEMQSCVSCHTILRQSRYVSMGMKKKWKSWASFSPGKILCSVEEKVVGGQQKEDAKKQRSRTRKTINCSIHRNSWEHVLILYLGDDHSFNSFLSPNLQITFYYIINRSLILMTSSREILAAMVRMRNKDVYTQQN